MVKKYLFPFIIAVFALRWLASAGPVLAQAPEPSPGVPPFAQTSTPAPAGFQRIAAAPGVELFRKDYPNGSPDFVQVIDLGLGARIQLLHGEITEPRPTKGSFGGPDPRMTSPTLERYWGQVTANEPLAFCVVNGGFFYMPEYPTRLAFPLKKDGEVITEGWGIDTYPDKKLILELGPGFADIKLLTKESLYTSKAPDILGGLAEDANKRIKSSVGRTFVGVDDRDGDQVFETVMILSTRTHYQSGAAGVLRSFGANKIMMLDGGGSTQLLCRDGHFIRSDRPIPQAVAIIAAAPPEVAAQLLHPPAWQSPAAGERIQLEIEIRNTGTLTWTPQDTHFTLESRLKASPEWRPAAEVVQPGATTVIHGTLPTPAEAGVHLIELRWNVTHGEKTSPQTTAIVPVIVLPRYLESQRGMVEEQLQASQGLPVEEVQARLEEWLAHSAPAQDSAAPPEQDQPQAVSLPVQTVQLRDIIWIPLLMLPVVILLGWRFGRKATG